MVLVRAGSQGGQSLVVCFESCRLPPTTEVVGFRLEITMTLDLIHLVAIEDVFDTLVFRRC